MIFSVVIFSCSTSKTLSTSETLLQGDWMEVQITNLLLREIKAMDIGSYGNQYAFCTFLGSYFHLARVTKSIYEFKEKKIYYTTNKLDQKRY